MGIQMTNSYRKMDGQMCPSYIAALLLALSSLLPAQDSAIPERLEVTPPAFTLIGPRAKQQLVITGLFKANDPATSQPQPRSSPRTRPSSGSKTVRPCPWQTEKPTST